MRVLQVIETGGPGGAETVFAALSSGLRGRRHQVTCLVGAGSWLPGEMARRGLPTAVLPDAGRLDATLLATIRDAIRSSAAELVHAHLFDGALYAALAARLEGVPCVVTLHGQVDVADRGISAFVKRTLFRRLAARVVCVSWALRHDVQASLHVAARRCIVIYNGIEGACGQRGGTTRTVHQLASTPWRLVAIGNIRPAKDYPTLLDAVARLRQAGLLVRLDVAGQPDRGGLFGSLLQQVDQLGLRDVVTFHGFLPDPLALLRDAACFVLSSSREGFSLATIEAMRAGVPVVATRSGGPEEILRDGETGLLVPPGDPDALANAIRRVLDDPRLAARLASAAGDDAAGRFSLDAMLDGYERLYAEVLGAT